MTIFTRAFFVTIVLSAFSVGANAADPKPRASWADSYSANGKCYCISTFDHGAGNLRVTVNGKSYNAREACRIAGKGPGKGKNPVYNTLQCGHQPGHREAMKNGYRDEVECPGRVDMGTKGCKIKGPKWDSSKFGGKADKKAPEVKKPAKKEPATKKPTKKEPATKKPTQKKKSSSSRDNRKKSTRTRRPRD